MRSPFQTANSSSGPPARPRIPRSNDHDDARYRFAPVRPLARARAPDAVDHLPVFGTIPPANSIRRLKSAIASFDGVPPLILKPHYHEAYDATFHAMFDDIAAARNVVVQNDKSRIVNLGFYPTDVEGIRLSFACCRAPYGTSLAFADFPNLRTSAVLLRGNDAGRLTSFTVFSLRTLSARQSGRADGRKIETLMPFCHLAAAYVPDDDGYEPTFLADPEQRPRDHFLSMFKAVVLLLERHRRKSLTDVA